MDTLSYHAIEFYFFASYHLVRPLVVLPVVIVFLLFMPTIIGSPEFPVFRVVLDPGHGGVGKSPMSVHGDRYDTISKRYLDVFKEGAERGEIHERAIAYSIARKTEKLLRLLGPNGDREKFYRILERYTDDTPREATILTLMSRGKSITEEEADLQRDPNAPFRLFDYPDEEGEMQSGRISRINAFKPHLVVSLHLAASGPRDFEGMNPVVLPPHSLLKEGLRYLKGERDDRKFFYKSPYRDWFIEEYTRSDFSWFLNDVSLYYTGSPLRHDQDEDRPGFKGYRYNMVRWAYADDTGWEHAARHEIPQSRYAPTLKDFVPEGRFWDRERSKYEQYRRDGGPEGFGGDNAFASYEIIRYICYSLFLHGNDHPSQKAGKSYISVWIMPLHVNAINAFIELGYLNRARDRHILIKNQDEIAEGIAVGIYSLLTGIEPRDKKYKLLPRGGNIDFRKYRTEGGASYFDAVTSD
jgi:hypothetical protein